MADATICIWLSVWYICASVCGKSTVQCYSTKKKSNTTTKRWMTILPTNVRYDSARPHTPVSLWLNFNSEMAWRSTSGVQEWKLRRSTGSKTSVKSYRLQTMRKIHGATKKTSQIQNKVPTFSHDENVPVGTFSQDAKYIPLIRYHCTSNKK